MYTFDEMTHNIFLPHWSSNLLRFDIINYPKFQIMVGKLEFFSLHKIQSNFLTERLGTADMHWKIFSYCWIFLWDVCVPLNTSHL